MTEIKIPGSVGTAMALVVGVSIYSATIVANFYLTISFLLMAIIVIYATWKIEKMHLECELKKLKLKSQNAPINDNE